MASKDTEGAVKADNPTSDHNRELNKELSVGTVQSRKSLVTSATEGEMAPETWYYTWRAVSTRFQFQILFVIKTTIQLRTTRTSDNYIILEV